MLWFVFIRFFKIYIILINIVLKGFWYPALCSDWYPMLLFESSLSSVFWNVLSYYVIRAYSVCDFDKCTTLFRYFSPLCYLELRSSEYISSLITMIFYHINVCTYLWLPQFQGHLSNFKVIEAESLLKHVKFRGSGHFLENTWEECPKIWHAKVSWPPSTLT